MCFEHLWTFYNILLWASLVNFGRTIVNPSSVNTAMPDFTRNTAFWIYLFIMLQCSVHFCSVGFFWNCFCKCFAVGVARLRCFRGKSSRKTCPGVRNTSQNTPERNSNLTARKSMQSWCEACNKSFGLCFSYVCLKCSICCSAVRSGVPALCEKMKRLTHTDTSKHTHTNTHLPTPYAREQTKQECQNEKTYWHGNTSK